MTEGSDTEQHVSVELLGLARVLTGETLVTVTVKGDATLRDVARALAVAYPALVGVVLTREGDLIAGSALSRDGREVSTNVDRVLAVSVPRPLILLTSPEGGR